MKTEIIQLPTFQVRLIRSKRKTIALQIDREGNVIVRAPERCKKAWIQTFIAEKQDWIERKRQETEIKKRQAEERNRKLSEEGQDGWNRKLSEAERVEYLEKMKEKLNEKAAFYADVMKVSYGRITVRDQKTRWGSCSAKGNLNFNWRLILAPEEVLDYVVVHELAHRLEMNHSAAFWNQVEKVLPDYRQQKLWLRENGQWLMSRFQGTDVDKSAAK